MRKEKRAKKKATTDAKVVEKEDGKIMEITMEELKETKPEDLLRRKPDGESKQEMLVDDPTKTVYVGIDIEPEVRINLLTLLQENADIFAFSVDEMMGIDPTVMIHPLHVDGVVRPVKQKKTNFQQKKIRPSRKRLISYWQPTLLKFVTTMSG